MEPRPDSDIVDTEPCGSGNENISSDIQIVENENEPSGSPRLGYSTLKYLSEVSLY